MQQAIQPAVSNAIQLRYMSIIFEEALPPYETAAFRGAIAQLMHAQPIFHNHDNEGLTPQAFYYRYPLVQYKSDGHRPMILFLGNAVDQVYHLFEQLGQGIKIQNKDYSLAIKALKAKEYSIQTTSQQYKYKLHHWMALNDVNYQKFQELESMVEQLQFLEAILTGHILAFATGIGWQVDELIKVQITSFPIEKFMSFKGMKMQTFSLQFKTNVFLPEFIGLGRSVSRGFGILRRVKTKKSE